MTAGPLVRELGPDDANAYVELRRESLARNPEAFSASPESDRASRLDFVRESLADTTLGISFGAFDEDRLVGALRLSREASGKRVHVAHLFAMYVREAERRRGVGRALLEAAIAQARRWPGIVQVELSVTSEAADAERLYLALGFERWGREPRALLVDGRYLDESHLVLPLR